MSRRESTGLPLRAMVMVLGFLGVAFLLVALNSLGSNDDSGSAPTSAATTITPAPASTASSSKPAQRPEIRVYNISDVAGAAEGVATRLRDAQWTVAETGNLVLGGVAQNTVYFSSAAGEREAAEDVGRLLAAPVAPRLPELAQQPPGLIVVVTG